MAVSPLDTNRGHNVPPVLTLSLCLTEQPCRLYATKHLRVLLRASVEFFSSWGMELLVTQLHDHSKAVSMEALDILDEACEDKVKTHATKDLGIKYSVIGVVVTLQ